MIGSRYINDPVVIILIIVFLSIFLLSTSTIITQGFERLAEANRLKSEFISIVSHQLRAPITNIQWTTEILMSGRLGPIEEKQTEYFRILKENLARIAETISDLLTVSRIETGRIALRKEEIFLPDLIKTLIKDFELFSKASNIEVFFSFDKDIPRIFTDQTLVRLVIENLFDNALRYSKGKGKIEIELSTKKGCAQFKIQDYGVGIPAADKPHIFQKFFRASNIMRYQTQGSGLGLFIAKSIATVLSGKIWFESAEGKGTTFWFTLPIK